VNTNTDSQDVLRGVFLSTKKFRKNCKKILTTPRGMWYNIITGNERTRVKRKDSTEMGKKKGKRNDDRHKTVTLIIALLKLLIDLVRLALDLLDRR
jgi:hypothetical protein